MEFGIMADVRQIDLYEFLVESELQQYYNSIKNELKIKNASHLKYATDEDLKQIGLSKPEIRRLRKFYEKYYPHGYLSKIKRLLQPPRKDDNQIFSPINFSEPMKVSNFPSKTPTHKHIIPADSISVNKQLGAGEFGIVQQGVWTNGTERIQVAIKCLCRERMQSNPIEFLKEAAIMHAIEHENIVRLYGVVLDTNSLMLVTELAHLRSLLECLKDSGLRVNFLTIPTLCEFAMQICNGMMYLENKRLIHRDLAARNILVFSKNKVKISDFGLSRALGVGKDYYKTNFSVNLKLPIAWCAPECITFLRFTNASDVWAYGVCLWEMFSYGFQPWAALTGLQILEAIDDPNYQRLEQPECCPKEYYNLMLKCWQHDPSKRPKFSEIYSSLPDMKPEQLKTVVNNCEAKKDHLLYLQGEIITVLDKNTNSPHWKGVLNSGKTGLFNPTNTVAYLEGLPSSINRDCFFRTNERLSKKKIRTEMISMPQNDLKHTFHVGLDGVYFGDGAFLGAAQQNNHLPRQIVTPYKPSEDIEQTPLLLPPTPTSPDSLQTASAYFPEELPTSSTNPTFINSNQSTPKNHNNSNSTFDFPPKHPVFNSSNPFASDSITLQNNNKDMETNSFTNANLEGDSIIELKLSKNSWAVGILAETPHEYHEISDDEMTVEKFDYGPSLLDEINSMFGSININNDDIGLSKLTNLQNNSKNETTEFSTKIHRKNCGSDNNGNKSKKKTSGIVKPISVKDERILNQAIEIANEISAKSMTDLVSDQPQTTQSPKRKFSFRFPHLSHHNSTERDSSSPSYCNSGSNSISHGKEKKNFTEELQSIPDLQNIITEEGREAYNSLIEKKSSILNFDPDMFTYSAKTLPRNMLILSNASKCNLGNNKKEELLSINQQYLNRPMTLPNRRTNRMIKTEITESNPLRILRNTNFPIVVTKASSLKLNQDKIKKITDKKKPNGISAALNNLNEMPYSLSLQNKQMETLNEENSNPIPLPPRDRNKVILSNAKRHVRKHPLIIPGYGVQRTLNKVTESPHDKSELQEHEHHSNLHLNHLTILNSYNTLKNIDFSDPKTMLHENIEQFQSMKRLHDSTKKIYANVEDINLNGNNTDSASLHFESVLERSFDQEDILSSPDVIDGFCPFSIQKEQYNKSKELNFKNSKISGLYVNEDELRNLDIDQPNNDLAENISLTKVKRNNNLVIAQNNLLGSNENKSKIPNANVTIPVEDTEHSVDELNESEACGLDKETMFNNSVSCEDLLEFAHRKPMGCERGVDSDEVRIMLKVLGKDVSPQKCLNALEIIYWDVHKAIKIIKLHNILNTDTLQQMVEFLQIYEWDLQTTVFKIKTTKYK